MTTLTDLYNCKCAKYTGTVLLTSGGPPRKMVPFCLTMMLSSAIAGTYAPPAVQLPITTAICGIPREDMTAWL